MKNILITGTSGFLGSRIFEYFRQCPELSVLAPSHKELDITSLDSCRKWFSINQADTVIHLAAISDIGESERNPELSQRVNVLGAENLARCAKEWKITGRFLFASSDQVYSGNNSDGRLNIETDSLCPINLYGREKAEAEERVFALLPDALGLRFAWMFDLKPGKANYLKNIILSVLKQETLSYAVNEYRGVSYAYEVFQNISMLASSKAPGGAYNFGSPAYSNSYESAIEVYKLIGHHFSVPISNLAVPVKMEQPRTLAMDQTKLRSVGIRFRDSVKAAEYCIQREADLIVNVKEK